MVVNKFNINIFLSIYYERIQEFRKEFEIEFGIEL